MISVIGCGWLGFPLAIDLQHDGYDIKGSTTTTEKLDQLQANAIEPYLITLDETGIKGNYKDFLSNTDTLIIAIPPGLRRNPDKNHVAEIKHLLTAVESSSIKRILYISSTSVFKDKRHFPVITSDSRPDGTSNAAKQLIEIEQQLKALPRRDVTILRFGGLIDNSRHPAKFLAGRQEVPNPKAPINLIHKTDCIGIIKIIITNNLWNITLNAAYPYHVDKATYYTTYCKTHGLQPPNFTSNQISKGKIISSDTVVQLLNYSFKMKP